MAYEFRFPDVGEGITEGELLAWKVREGDVVAEDQTLAEVETDKAVVEMPSPKAGRIVSLHGAEGDVIKVGDVLAVIEEGAGAAAPAAKEAPPAAKPAEPIEEEPYTGSVVGRLEEAPEEEEAPPAPARPVPARAGTLPPPVAAAGAPPSAPPAPEAAGTGPLAMPSVRALAHELGVDLMAIRGTGPGGRILKQDVEDVAEAAAYGRPLPGALATLPGAAPSLVAPPAPAPGAPVAAPGPAAEATAAAAAPAPAARAGRVVPAAPQSGQPLLGGALEHDGSGPVERVPFRGIRRTMAKRMAESLAKQAQVTTTDEADVTIIRRIREKERTVAAERGVRLTYLAFAVKACTQALIRFPRLNASLSEAGDDFVLKRYYNIGIAIDTKNGLVVPNIKNADQKSIFQIAAEIVDLVDRAEQRQVDLQDLHGGTFTITNYGAIGGLFATPVINYPEVAILGMGRVREVPVVREAKVENRLLLPLSLTFDHQLIDGAEAARFLNLIISYLEDPDLLLLEGA